MGFALFSQAPNWSVIPADFQFTSTLTGQLIINDTIINSSNNILGAFIDGEVRGVAHPTEVGDTKMYFLTMYANIAAGENVTFQAYLGNQDSIHHIVDTITFSSNFALGTPAAPYELRLNAFESVTFLPFTLNYTTLTGQFSAVNLLGYIVNNGNLPIEFTISDVGSNLTVSLVNNTLQVSHLGEIGLDSVLVAVVDSNDLSVVYDQQYMYYDVLPVNDTMYISGIPDITWGKNTTPCLSLSQYLVNPDEDSIAWEVLSYFPDSIGDTTVDWFVNTSVYQFSMSLVIETFINGNDLQNIAYQLGIFDQGNLVGEASPQVVDGKVVFFITAYSNFTNSTLSFKLYDRNHSILYDERTTTAPFIVNGIVGDIANPLQLYFGTHSYYLMDDLLCINLFDSIPGPIDSFMVIATEVNTADKFSDTARFTISYAEEQQPFLNGIPDQSVFSGVSFTDFDLNTYLTEMDGDSVSFSVIGSDNVIVNINPHGVVSAMPNSGQWVGQDIIVFVATDVTGNALFDKDTVVFSVLPNIDVSGIDDQTISTTEAFAPVELLDHLVYPYPDSLQWEVTSSELITLIVGTQMNVYFPSPNWVGEDTLYIGARHIRDQSVFDMDTAIFRVEDQRILGTKEAYSEVEKRIYPNPSKGIFNIPDSIENVQVLNIIGKQVAFELEQNHLFIKTPGLYFVSFEMNGATKVEKIIVKP